jgi:hypothetical protein
LTVCIHEITGSNGASQAIIFPHHDEFGSVDNYMPMGSPRRDEGFDSREGFGHVDSIYRDTQDVDDVPFIIPC